MVKIKDLVVRSYRFADRAVAADVKDGIFKAAKGAKMREVYAQEILLELLKKAAAEEYIEYLEKNLSIVRAGS